MDAETTCVKGKWHAYYDCAETRFAKWICTFPGVLWTTIHRRVCAKAIGPVPVT